MKPVITIRATISTAALPSRACVAYRGRGLGLISMSERLEAVGGALDIQSAPGKKTTVDLVVPLVATAIAM